MAKDVITRFKLETTGFDSKIKEAAKELSAYSKTATQAKEGFNQFTKANVDAARALGTIATSTTNAKDRAKELVGAFNEAAKAYNSLTKEQQQSDWAKALAGSLTQLQQRIKETKAEMQGLGDSMKGANDGSFLSKLGGKMDGALAVFGGNLMTKAAGMGIGLVTEMTDAVKQGIELAKAGEGVRIAFERLGRGDILQGLREATHGTVTDLELMKAAVKFNDFKLPVEELGTMLAFAQQKAKDTGQSVDYMVDSIVTGLGRKSLMILDNLGLSATEIRERMKETGDMTKAVGAIIREQMASAGEYVETAADRAAQANVSLQNKMEELGRKVAPLEESFNNLWTSMKVGILDVIGGPLTDLLNKLTQAGRMANQYSLMGGNGKVGRMTSNLAGASEDSRQNIYQLQKAQFKKYISPREQQIQDIRAWQSGERNESLQKRINVITEKYGSLDTTKIQAEVDAAKKMLADYEQAAKPLLNPVNVNVNTQQAETNVKKLRQQLKELEEQRKNAVKAGDQEQVENLTKQISQVKTNIGYLDPKANKTGASSKTIAEEKDDFVEINGLINMATERVSDLQRRIREAPTESMITELRDQLKDAQAELDKLNGKEVKIQMETGTSIQNDAGMSSYIASIKQQLETADYGTSLYKGLSEQLADMTTLQNLVGESLKAGLGTAMFDVADAMGKDFWTRAMEGGVEDTDWQAIIDKINEKLKEMNLDPIAINFKTGNLSKAEKKESSMEDGKKMLNAISQLTGGLQQMGIELPSEIQGVIGAIQGAMQVIEVVNTIIGVTQTTALTANTAAMISLEAALWANTATSLIPFANGGVVPGFANGGMIDSGHSPSFLSFSKAAPAFATGGVVPQTFTSMPKFATGGFIQKFNKGGTVEAGHAPDFLSFSKGITRKFASGGTIPHANDGYFVGGTHFSSDVTPIMANAGELVLNKAQQGVIANQLQGGNNNNVENRQPYVNGELIYLGLNNYLKRTGRGEIVVSKR